MTIRTALVLVRALLWACLAAAPATRAASQDAAAVARIGFLVTSLSQIDPADASYAISGYAWSVAPAGTLDVATQLQLLARSSELEVVEVVPLDDGSIYTALEFQAIVDQTFDLRDFPFDRQTLRLNVETEVPADRLRLEADSQDSRIADFLTVSGWTVAPLRFEERVVAYDTAFGGQTRPVFSRLTLLIDIERQRSPLVFERFTGYLMALLITGLIYLVPTDQIGVRIGMATSAIFAAVGNRYGLDAVLGIESAFGLVEQLSLVVFAAIFVSMSTTLLVYQLGQSRTLAQSNRFNRRVGLAAVTLSFALSALAVLNARA